MQYDKTWILLTDFKNYSSMKLYENLFNDSQVVPCSWVGGQMDRHDEANSHF
jgi:hypothetical protein